MTNTLVLKSQLTATDIGRYAAQALTREANLPHKPGLVGPDGSRGHSDMDVELMRRSAAVLEPTFIELAQAGMDIDISQELRDEIGRIGRRGEAAMMEATGGVNTHRGAIWNVGLLAIATAGLTRHDDSAEITALDITQRAGSLASITDSFTDNSPRPGAAARKKYKVGGAVSEAASGFPHILAILQAMDFDSTPLTFNQQLRGLLTSMSSLGDTCILHRGGPEALQFVQTSATRLLMDTAPDEDISLADLRVLDLQMTEQNLSPGGSADLLAGALFLTSILGETHADNH